MCMNKKGGSICIMRVAPDKPRELTDEEKAKRAKMIEADAAFIRRAQEIEEPSTVR